MRLIDADALKQAKCKWCVRKVCKRTGWTCGFINLIDNVPTAYDVDGVIGDIQRAENFDKNGHSYVSTIEAIDIVRRGGGNMMYKFFERLKIKRTPRRKYRNMPIYGKRLFTDFGGIGFYRVVSIYGWKEFSECAELPGGSHWFEHSMAIIRSEKGVKYSIPWIELGMRSVYEDGNIVLK